VTTCIRAFRCVLKNAQVSNIYGNLFHYSYSFRQDIILKLKFYVLYEAKDIKVT